MESQAAYPQADLGLVALIVRISLKERGESSGQNAKEDEVVKPQEEVHGNVSAGGDSGETGAGPPPLDDNGYEFGHGPCTGEYGLRMNPQLSALSRTGDLLCPPI